MHRSTANSELARRLEAYALARLSPDAAATARMRSTVMAVATAGLGAGAGARGVSRTAATEPTPIFSRRAAGWVGRPRRIAVGLLAASLALTGVAGAALASGPGGPLYDARLWIERAALPSDPGARATAELGRLEARLGEAVRAADAGNQPAMTAALAAYRQTLDEALEGADQDDRSARLEAAIAHHRAVLERLLGTVPVQARDAIERAIDKSDKATEKIVNDPKKTPKPNPKPTPRATSGPKPGGAPARTDRPGQGGGNSNGGSGQDRPAGG